LFALYGPHAFRAFRAFHAFYVFHAYRVAEATPAELGWRTDVVRGLGGLGQWGSFG
jgi:hypothetical protein